MTVERIAEAAVTGAWLGLVQVALAFSVMAGAGAAATLFFALTASWLAGSASGILGARGPRVTALLLGAGLMGLIVARWWLAEAPFSAGALVAGLAAAFAGGAYAGAFLGDRARAWGDVRFALFHENNGFVVGYALGGSLLLADMRALDAAVAIGAVLAVAWRLRALRLGLRAP